MMSTGLHRLVVHLMRRTVVKQCNKDTNMENLEVSQGNVSLRDMHGRCSRGQKNTNSKTQSLKQTANLHLNH
jgi:hypothetical protein